MTAEARILCAWFPHWPITRRRRSGEAPEPLFSTIQTERGRRILAHPSPEALEAGLRPGMALAQARAIAPSLAIADDDPDTDLATLASLASWAERYTPLATPDTTHGPASGLLMDITGCAHLHGGEAELAANLAHHLATSAIPAQLAIAGTAGAAWALARHSPGILPPGQESRALAPLPITLLRLPEPLVAALHHLGLRSIGALARIPRAELATRFGPLPGQRLAHALGETAEPLSWPRQPTPWHTSLNFPEPIGTPEDLTRTLHNLATTLCTRLEAAQQGGTRFTASFQRVDNTPQTLTLHLATPSRDAPRIARLLADKLPELDPGFGIETARLDAATAPLPLTQPSLDEPATPPLATTIDDLAQTLPIWRAAPSGSHIPERITRHTHPSHPTRWPQTPDPDTPIRLLSPPEPIEATAPIPDDPPLQFRWRGALHRIRAATGPNRIAAEWWTTKPHPTRPETDRLRDYYRVEDTTGARFWLFRTGLTGATKWFVHGVFG